MDWFSWPLVSFELFGSFSEPFAPLDAIDGTVSSSNKLTDQSLLLRLSLRSMQSMERSLLLSLSLRSRQLVKRSILLSLSLRSRELIARSVLLSLSLRSR